MRKFKLSVIVPVYNAQDYLEQCIESILMQNMDFVELILIDDGSTDQSGALCDKYTDRCDYLRVIHQENQGILASRKKGVEVSSSQYVTFIDSDDWVEDHYFDELLEIIDKFKDIELVVSALMCDKGDFSFEKRGGFSPGLYNIMDDKIIEHMLYDWDTGEMGIPGFACGKLFRRDLLLRVISNIDEEIVHGEDYAWFYSYVPMVSRVLVLEKIYYHYRMHPESASTSFDLSSFAQFFALKKFFASQLKKQYMDKISLSGINQLLWGGIMHALREVYGLSVGYIFPYELVDKGSRVIIYGAGVVGKCYYNCLKSGNYAKIAAVVDKNNSAVKEFDCEVQAPEIIENIDYDIIVVAVEPKELYENIKIGLVDMGIEARKIVWDKPKILCT